MNGVVSKGITECMPTGKNSSNSLIFSLTSLAVSRAFAPVANFIANPDDALPFNLP